MSRHVTTRGRLAALVLAVVFLGAACDGNSTVPAALPTGTSPTQPSTTAPVSPLGYEISDVRLVTVRDPVIFWQVTFDARWGGPGAPQNARCRWRMLGPDGVAIISGGMTVDGSELNDEVAASVYPDEIPGVPKEAKVDCRTD